MFSVAKLEMPVLNAQEHWPKTSYFVFVFYRGKMFQFNKSLQ